MSGLSLCHRAAHSSGERRDDHSPLPWSPPAPLHDTPGHVCQLVMGLTAGCEWCIISLLYLLLPVCPAPLSQYHTKPQVWRFSRLFIWRQGACRCNTTRTRSPVITALKASSLGTLQPPIETVFTRCQWFYNNLYSWPSHYSGCCLAEKCQTFSGFFILSPHQLQLKSSHLLSFWGSALKTIFRKAAFRWNAVFLNYPLLKIREKIQGSTENRVVTVENVN